MERSRTILRNTLSNAGIQSLGVATAFVLLPLLIRHFGKELFGIYICVATLAILANFISASLSMCLMKSVPELLARKEHELLSHTLAALVPLSFLLHLVLGAIVFTFPSYGLRWFNILAEHHATATSVLRIVGIATVARFLGPVSDGVLRGLEHFHLANRIQILPILASVVAYVAARVWAVPLQGFVLIHQAGFVVATFITYVVAWRVLPVRVPLTPPRFSPLKRIWGFGTYLMVNQTADHLMYTMDKVILQALLGSASVTDYHVSRRTHDMSLLLVSLPLSAVLPSLSGAFSSGDAAYARRVNTTGAFLYALLVIPPLVSLLLLLDRFMALWIGADLLVMDTVFAGQLFLLATIVAVPFRVVAHSLVARGRVRLLGGSKLIYAVVNVVLSIALVKHMGLIGVVIPTVAFWLVVHPATMFYLARDESYITYRQLVQLLLPSLLTLGAGWVLVSSLDTSIAAIGWGHFVAILIGAYTLTILLYVVVASLLMPSAFRDAMSFARTWRGTIGRAS